MADTPPKPNSINYIELPMTDMAATKQFYGSVFGWTFEDWGPSYISFAGAGIDGGFTTDTPVSGVANGVLPVLYSDALEAKLAAVRDAGATIVKEIYDYPGGRRFEFTDPNGNYIAVWSH